MRIRKQIRKRIDPLDRTILNLTGSNYPDDQISLRDLFENIFICGSTGTGKTSTVGYRLAKGILACQDLALEDRIGMIVFLYKSSDAEQWIKWADEAGRSNDVRIISSKGKDSINILEAYRDKEAISAVNTLMVLAGLGMSGSAEQQGEAYWEQMNRQRLHRLILLAQISGEPMNITNLYRLHSSAPQTPEQAESKDFRNHSYCWEMISKAHVKMGKDHPQFKLVENYFVYEMPNMADRTQSSILSMTGAILEPFISSNLLNKLFCRETTLSLDDLLDGSIVLLDLPIQQYEYAGKLAQMMFKHILQKRIEERELSLSPNPVCFWIDEYQHFISRYDPLFLSTARSSRAGSILMTQNISNLYAQIGGNGKIAEEKINALLALNNHKIFLAQNNSITNEFAAKTIGMGIHRLSNTSVQMQQFGASAGISESYQYQVMPHEFTMLKRGGKHHGGIVETIITATGKTFSNGKNYLRRGFKQPWM